MPGEKGLKQLPIWLRRTLLAVLITAAVAGIIVGVLMYIRSNSSAVEVYPVSSLKISYSGLGQSQTEGNVFADRIQSVLVSNTQIVNEIYVQEGDTVHVGDPILSYDTTLTDIELERQEIKIGQLQLQLQQEQANLKKINSFKVYDPSSSTSISGKELTPVAYLPYLWNGKGTAEEPYIALWNDETCLYSEGSFQNIVNQDIFLETEQHDLPLYIILETRENDCYPDGYVVDNCLLTITSLSPLVFRRSPAPDYNKNYPPSMENTDVGSFYTAAELAEMKKTAADKIAALEMDLKKAQLKYETLEYELTNGMVLSKIEGVVETLNDPELVCGTNDPAVVVSGGGGYFVSGVLSEDELNTMHVGDSLSAMSWESYSNFDVVITEISEYPVDNTNSSYYHYSEGNSNVSLYPFVAAIGSDDSVREGEYLSLSYTPRSTEEMGIYVDNMFIRSENGQSYVYVRGENGLLERRNVKTGAKLWGSYTEILEGFTEEDFLAFPYGRNVKEGAKTTESTTDQLYMRG